MKNKKGISLIVLVITIIVMIILAAAVVIALSNSGIINKANDAVDLTNEKEIQNLATVVWAEVYIDGARGEELEREVLEKLENYTEEYNITVTDAGVKVESKDKNVTNGKPVPEDWKASVSAVTIDDVPIPKGFVKSPYDNEGTKDGGLVIYALTEDEIREGKQTITDDYQVALETRNQFVWVPVKQEEFKAKFVRTHYVQAIYGNDDAYPLSNVLGTGAWELVLTEDNMPSQDTINDNISTYVSSETLDEATKMYQSVKKYGGFYVARYEAGVPTTYQHSSQGYMASRVSISDGTYKNLSVTMGKYPYNAIAWGTTMEDETRDNGAVSLSRLFYPKNETTYGVVSTLMYGVQWDRVLSWWKELNPTINYDDSSDYGIYVTTDLEYKYLNSNAKYSNYASRKYSEWTAMKETDTKAHWLFTTGAYKKASVCNIYDMAGNLAECTMAGSGPDEHLFRGSYFSLASTYIRHYMPAAPDYQDYAYSYGFRPTLYIK